MLVNSQQDMGTLRRDSAAFGSVEPISKDDVVGSTSLGTAPCTLEVMLVSKHLDSPVQNHQSRSGPSCHGVIDDHHGGDQCSCTSLGKLRKNIAELRK
ncbi:hypothetical protein Nepgr_017514 [Nepenthes gracilis]|uniref:Uncharacterized protein n=1 Tax=Nepenthes gracilis TaxID=150966 RepID=A0AAD3XSJ4_NEPGR|nr:hypothetical protein Nepgr_017514 [Nepenthes gracilis]